MKKNIFSLALVRDPKYNIQFFRSHVLFISEIFCYLSKQKMYFLKNPLFLRKYFKKELLEYLKIEKSSLLNRLFLNIISALDEIYATSSRDLFSYINTFLLMFLEKGYYSVAFLYCASSVGITEEKIKEVYAIFSKQYTVNQKLCLVLVNENLQKGFLIKYKNCLIDISIKKLIYQLENTIDLEKIGEIVNEK